MLMTRRMFQLSGAAAVAVAASTPSARAAQAASTAPTAPTMLAADWRTFRRQFVTAEGRVVDVDNGGVSHSEGQGWGLTLAAEAGDRDAFERILSWTSRNLAVRDDGLHAWRYVPGAGVTDSNNATDGDIFVAYGLARAARRWDNPAYRDLAATIAGAVVERLVRQVAGRSVLLPAAQGFEREGEVVVNLSYYPFFAFEELSRLGHADVWSRLWTDGLSLATEARFGRFGLPPDWLSIERETGTLRPAAGWPARFSYDAVRIPLYLALSRLSPPGLTGALNAYWSPGSETFGAAWVDLHTGRLAPYPTCAGFRAVQRRWLASQGIDTPAIVGSKLHPGGGYFSSALVCCPAWRWRTRPRSPVSASRAGHADVARRLVGGAHERDAGAVRQRVRRSSCAG